MSGTMEVQGALYQQAATALAGKSVAWPGKSFTPGSSAWYRVSFVTTEQPVAAEVGVNGRNRHTGMLQIDVFYPKANQGEGQVRQEGERIAATMKRGDVFTSGGQNVRITSSAASRCFEEEEWLHVPVKIWWRADIEN